MRARLACVAAMAIIVASCGASTTPSPTAPGSATPSPRVVPVAATPAVVGHWETAGTMAIGRFSPHAVPLADGSTLVVGNDACGRDYSGGCRCTDCVRDDSVATETWDPSTNSWSTVASLNKPRADFVAVSHAVVSRSLDPRRAIAVAVAANGASFIAGRIVGDPWQGVFG